MGKGDKPRAKARKAEFKRAMPTLPEVKRPMKRGRARMEQIKDDQGEASVVLKARARMAGVTLRPEIKKNGEKNHEAIKSNNAKLAKMRSQSLGEAAGIALHLSLPGHEAARLYAHYAGLTAAEDRYHRSIGKSIHAKTAKIEMMPERVETRADDTPDLRTQDERDEAAKSAWRRWDGLLDAIGLMHRSSIDTARMGFAELVVDGSVTVHGKRFVAAMIALDGRV